MTRMAKQATLGQFGKMTFVALAWALLLGAIAPLLRGHKPSRRLYKFTSRTRLEPEQPLNLGFGWKSIRHERVALRTVMGTAVYSS
jgi:hypothetical protein